MDAWLVLRVGCQECDEITEVLGVFWTEELAAACAREALDKQKANDWKDDGLRPATGEWAAGTCRWWAELDASSEVQVHQWEAK